MSKVEAVFVGHTAADTHILVENCSTRTTIGGRGFSSAFTASLVLNPEYIGLISRMGNDNFGLKAKHLPKTYEKYRKTLLNRK